MTSRMALARLGWFCVAVLSCTLAMGPAAAAESASVVIDRMLAKYRDAKSYSDKALVTIQLKTADGDQSGEFDAQLQFERPNKLRMEFQPAVLPDGELAQRLVVSDGKRVFGKTEGYDPQVVVADAPDKDVAASLFASPGFAPLLTDGITGGNVFLSLLTSGALPPPLDKTKAKLLDQAKHNGEMLDRFQFDAKDGKLTLWIDPKSSIVKRIEFPVAPPVLEKWKALGVTGIDVAADIKDAKFDEPIPAEKFAWPKKAGERYVRHLVTPLLAGDDSKLLGQAPPEFEFTTSQGDKQKSQDLKGKVVVIDFWATWCGWCLKGMPLVDKVRQKYAANDKVRFIAMSQDEADVTDAKLAETLKSTKVEIPWARVTGAGAGDINSRFGFAGIPAMVVLGVDGNVQYQHVGYDPNLEEKLPPVIDALLAGQDLAKKVVEAREVQQRDYEKRLDAVKVDVP